MVHSRANGYPFGLIEPKQIKMSNDTSKYKAKFPIYPKDEQEREFKKAVYIEDKRQKLDRIREVIAMHPDRFKKNAGEDEKYNTAFLEAIRDESKREEIGQLQSMGLFYGWAKQAYKRRLELEIYIDSILDECKKKQSKQEKINFLIDKQFDSHNDVYDNDLENLAFKEETEARIIDELQEEIRKITGRNEVVQQVEIKPIQWGLDQSILGTVFGVLVDEKTISGNKAECLRHLVNMFENVKETTLEGAIYFKVKDSGYKKYNPRAKKLTETFVTELIKLSKNKPM